MDIRCRKCVCEHNCKECCSLTNLNIGENALCESYSKDINKENKSLVKTMFENPKKPGPFKLINSYNLKCEAVNCKFNENLCCKSNGITVLDDEENASCQSFFPR